jgi:endonuclease/exonuclease/phosphatase family metal-dependent hydrolase
VELSDGVQSLLRILTYNVHRCLGIDGKLLPARIAEVIASCEPDIVALQELDVGRVRTGGVDQAHAIAHELGMTFHFQPALRVMEERYGDAILTARPSRLVRAGALPGLAGVPYLEPRARCGPPSRSAAPPSR